VVPNSHVECAAANLQRLAVTNINLDQLDSIRVRMRAEFKNLRDHNSIKTVPEEFDLFTAQPQ
jgi:hypothetical protein